MLAPTPVLLPASPARSILPSGKTAGSQITEAAGGPFEEAERLFRERNFPAAEPLFRGVPETSPHYPKAQLRLGTIYYAAGQPALAETFLRTHLRLRESAEGHTLLAGVQLNQGKFDPAIESARKAIALDKGYARARTALGMIYATMEDFPKALAAFRNALELDDKDANTWFLLGRSYFLSHQPAMAREALENALQLNPQVVEIYSQLAQTLARLGESARAEEVFTRGVENNRLRTPPDKGIHIAYGLFLAGLDRGEESCEQFRAVTRFAPQDPEAHYELAKVLFQMKRVAEAARAADRAVALDRSDYRIHYLLARIYTVLGDAGKAEEHARNAVYVEQQ
ncbi:MAG: tetratricopeptide repeat protein [Candidatus Aminicenantes bacterium]|nr:tetratricopeptide repeat protein [Candidatus Aminicenantes bacterium]